MAKAKVLVKNDILKLSETERKNGDKTRKKYYLDFSDPRCLDPESYQILEHSSEPHTALCKTTYFSGLKKDFRHAHVQKGLVNERNTYDETVRNLNLRRTYGVDFESLVIGDRRKEINAFHDKMRYAQKCPKTAVPKKYSEIERTDWSSFGVKAQKWHQKSSEKMEVFFLDEELEMLENENLYVDGTFTLVKDLSYSQIYIISTLIKKENRIFSYPLFFSLMKGKTSANYREFFQFL